MSDSAEPRVAGAEPRASASGSLDRTYASRNYKRCQQQPCLVSSHPITQAIADFIVNDEQHSQKGLRTYPFG
jgi:hypothetical protein